jgi:RNA polymerase sigma-70 factor, ECF subfamily
VALTDVDQDLLKRCLAKKPGSWNDFVDRFLSLIYHAIHYTAHLRSARLSPEDVEDIAAEVLVQIVSNDYKVLREFKGTASLATYLTVIARRICVHELTRRQAVRDSIRKGESRLPVEQPDDTEATSKAMDKLEDVEALLRKLGGKEREIVRQFYLEGRTYEEISTELDVPVNSIGSVLTRARSKLRELSKSYAEIPAVAPNGHKSSNKSSNKSSKKGSMRSSSKLPKPADPPKPPDEKPT